MCEYLHVNRISAFEWFGQTCGMVYFVDELGGELFEAHFVEGQAVVRGG